MFYKFFIYNDFKSILALKITNLMIYLIFYYIKILFKRPKLNKNLK